jgi:hypothetical protein
MANGNRLAVGEAAGEREPGGLRLLSSASGQAHVGAVVRHLAVAHEIDDDAQWTASQ